MRCPACSNSLTELKVGSVLVDVCRGGCGGVWFDFKELKAFDEPHEFLPDELLSIARNHSTTVDHDALRSCPKCGENEVLCRRFYDFKGQVEVDQCLKCSGIWLDVGELGTVRGQYETEAERTKAADAYLEGQLEAHQDFYKQQTAVAREEADRPVRTLFQKLFS